MSETISSEVNGERPEMTEPVSEKAFVHALNVLSAHQSVLKIHEHRLCRLQRDMRAAFLLMGTGFILASLMNLPDLIRLLGGMWP